MDKAKFNSRMARPKFSKGGYIKKIAGRKYFDTGGIADNSVSQGPVQGGGTSTNTQGIGGISSALGLNAQSANINSGTNQAQLGNAYTGTQNAINSQIGLTNTLNPQAANAAANQNAVAQQELAMTQGGGPNPAQNELAQATGTNVANQAALMAGQRGSSGNIGLTSRNIGQQGAATQQTAAGQAATLQAQQQIAAQQNLTNLANQQIGQTQGANTALNTAQQNEQNTLQNANTSYNNAAVGMQSNINSNNAATNSNVLGGITSALSGSAITSMLNKGGEVHPEKKHKLDFVHKMTHLGLKHYDDGGNVSPSPDPTPSSLPPEQAQTIQDISRQAFGYDEGGQVDTGNYTQSTASSGPSVAAAGTQAPITWGGSGGSGGGGGGAGILALLADGGQIEANPLIGAITNHPVQENNSGNYTSSSASSGPNVAGAGTQSPDYSPKSGGGKNSDPSSGSSNDISDATGTPGGSQWAGSDSGAASDLSFAAKGGEINYHDHFHRYFKGGDAKEVKAMVSPQERYLEPEEVEQIKHGADPSKLGKIFPGKDKVPGKDSFKNDTVPVTLREGGIVVPLHIEKTKNPDKMRLFVLKSLRSTGKHMKKPAGA